METRGAVLVGVLAEIYLTENGELKKPVAVPELSAIVFHRKTAAELQAAISKGVSVLKSGGVCVVDFHVEPPTDRSDGIGHRPTGG